MTAGNSGHTLSPKSVETIGEHAIGYEYDEKTGKYKKIDGVKINCFVGSAAEKYAKDNGFEYEATDERFSYRENDDGTVTITGCYNYDTEVTIPSKYHNKKIVEIADEAFESYDDIFETDYDDLDNIEKIIIPEGIKRIGSNAFIGCKGLKEVVLPSTLTEIGEKAFQYCSNLEKIKFNNGLETIGHLAFSRTNKKELSTIPSSVKFIGKYVFSDTPWLTDTLKNNMFAIKDGFLILVAENTRVKTIEIPSNVKYICDFALANQAFRASELIIPGSVKYIGEYAFYQTNLFHVKIEEGVETVGKAAFANCQSHSIKLPKSLKNIGYRAFGYEAAHIIGWEPEPDEKAEDTEIVCLKGSEAEKYAKENGVPYKIYSKDPVRLAGNGRYETAAKISEFGFEKADTVVLAYSMGYADALAGVPYANALNAPILLTNTNSLDKATLAEIKRLGAKKIKILGGEGAIGQNVIDELVKNGINKDNIERISGQSRYSTATAIAEKLNAAPEEVFFVYGGGYADALSVSPVAATKKVPIIYLTTSGEINADTAAYLAKLKEKNCVKHAYIIGGEGVISDEMMKKVNDMLGLRFNSTLKRVYGFNRYFTCLNVIDTFDREVYTGKTVCLATGTNFPDALAGGVLAAKLDAPLMLVGSEIDEFQCKFLNEKLFYNLYVFGGTGAVSDEVVKAVDKYRF